MSTDYGGGGGGATLLPDVGTPPSTSHPFLDFGHGAGGFFSSLVHGDARVISDIAALPGNAAMGVPKLIGSGWHELHQDLAPIPGRLIHPSRMWTDPVDNTYLVPGAAPDPNHPLTQGITQGIYGTAADVEQVPRAGLNTVGQIPRLVGLQGYEPGGASVGELGTGPGLLGKTDLAKAAARGGGGVAPRLLNDLANIALVTGPLSGALSASSEAAAAEAAARTSELGDLTTTADAAHAAAETSVKEAEKAYQQASAQLQPAHVAAQTGDPTAAVQWNVAKQQADAAAESLRQAREFQANAMQFHEPGISAAQEAADAAQARADRLASIAKVGKTVHNLGSTAANSPFAALHLGGQSLGLLADKLAGTEVGEHVLGPESRIGKYVSTVADHAREQGIYKHLQREGEIQFADEAAKMRRAGEQTAAETSTVEKQPRSLLHPLAGGRLANGMVQDADAQAVATMAQTGEFDVLKHYAIERPLPGGDDELTARFIRHTTREDGTPQYSPEQVHLALEAAREDTPRGVELAKQIPRTREAYGTEGGLEEQQARNYSVLRGQTEPIMGGMPGEGAFGQVEHNLEGEGPSIEHLHQWSKFAAKMDSLRDKHGRLHDQAATRLGKLTEKLGKLGLSDEDLKNPKALLDRAYKPAESIAREWIGDADRLRQLAAEGVESSVKRIAQRVIDGKLNPDIAAKDLSSQIVKLGAKDPEALSAPMASVMNDYLGRVAGTVPKGMPNLASAAKPAELLGRAQEKVRAGTAEYDRGVNQIARGQVNFGKGMELTRESNRPPSPRQLAAAKRLVDATTKLRELQERVARSTEGETGDVALPPVNIGEARSLVSEVRQAAKEWHRAQAKAINDELAEAGVKGINPTPPSAPRVGYAKNRGGNARAGQRIVSNVPDWSNGGWDFADHVFREMDPKFKAWAVRNGYLETGEGRGLSPEQAVEQWASHIGGPGVRLSEDPAGAMEEWLAKVEDAYHHTIAGRAAVEKSAGSEDAVHAALATSFGASDPMVGELARIIGSGTLTEASAGAVDWLERYGQRAIAEMGGDARLQPGGDVHTALAADRENEMQRGIQGDGRLQAREALDEHGQALYDRQVAEDQAQIQGEHIVPQREAQLGAAPSPGRRQGFREGSLLGRANEQMAQGEAATTRGDAAVQRGNAVLGNAGDLTRQAASPVAHAIGVMYAKAGKLRGKIELAQAEFDKQTRALDRIDTKLAERRDTLMQEPAAQPRAWRPVAQLVQRMNADFVNEADNAEREFGEGAGDVYRAAAADAQNAVILLRRSGFDPQFLIGLRNGETPEKFVPTVKSALSGRPGQLPRAAETGQRSEGLGLAHATTYKEITEQATARLHQIIKNATAQSIMDNLGGSLHDMLVSRGMDSAELQKMKPAELVNAMHDAHLSAWNASDWRGRFNGNQPLTLDTPVIPAHIWKSYAPFERETSNRFLKGYDTALRHWKAADLYLTGRWHTSLLLGHAVMNMVGIGTNPASYFRDVQIATRLERLRLGLGTAEDRAFVESHANAAQLRGLRISDDYTPGSVVDRGYSTTEFGGGERELQNESFMGRHAPGDLHPIQAGWRFQSHIDNVNRTAAWLGALTKGLDKQGLADFRTAYPEMAHLSDAEIKNEAAIRLSIRTIGDYKNLSAFEQNVVKRIIPFYPWMRHVTKLALNLAIHDPVRTAWMLHLGLMFSPKSSGVDWLDSSYDRGSNRWLTPPRWDPFDSLAHITDTSNPFGAISPLINVPVEAATGYDLQHGKEISRPWSTPSGPLGLKSDLYAAGSTVPLLSALRTALPALAGHAPIARYGSGDPVLSNHQLVGPDAQQIPFTTKTLPNALAPLAPLLGLGSQEVIDAPSIVQAQQRKLLSTAKARATWDKELRAAQAARG